MVSNLSESKKKKRLLRSYLLARYCSRLITLSVTGNRTLSSKLIVAKVSPVV